MTVLKAPFPWFGGKSRAAHIVWPRFGDCLNFVEPFAGSLAVLLARPFPARIETINDKDCYVSNFWRALSHDPDCVAHYADWPVNECVPAGTMIATPEGAVPVERVTAGMVVWGFDGKEVVQTTVIATKQSATAEPLTHIGNLSLTGSHPVWTKDGYTEAANVTPGMHIGLLANENDCPVSKPDLIVLQYGHESKSVGNLHTVRPQDKSGALCGGDVPGQAAIQRAFIPRRSGRKSTPGLLDSFTNSGRGTAGLSGRRTGSGERMARGGTKVDRHLSHKSQINQSNGRGRGNAGIQTNAGTQAEMVTVAGRGEVRGRSFFGHAGQEAHTGGHRENPGGRNGAQAYQSIEIEAIGRTYGQDSIIGTPGQVVSGTLWKGTIERTQAEDSRYNGEQKAGSLRGNGANLCLNHRDGAGHGGIGSVNQSGDSEGRPLQGVSLPTPVAVYNFQTTTGNYFANQILVHNCDLHARHLWLVNQVDFRERMMSDPEYYDAKIAGWWVWGLCAWIGSGWCDISRTERAQQIPELHGGRGGHRAHPTRQMPQLRPYQGVEGLPRQLPAISERPGSMGIHGPAINGAGVPNKPPFLQHSGGVGVHRPSVQMPHLNGDSGAAGAGIHASAFDGKTGGLYAYMSALAERLRRVRVTCGDWQRIVGPSVTYKIGTSAVFLDPPYPENLPRFHAWLDHLLRGGPRPESLKAGGDNRVSGLYANDSVQDIDRLVAEVHAWCREEIQDKDIKFSGPRYLHPKLRIALCGYEGEHDELTGLGWDCIAWKANGGYGGQRKGKVKNVNAGRERVWFSPHCLSVGVANGRHDPRDYSTLFTQELTP